LHVQTKNGKNVGKKRCPLVEKNKKPQKKIIYSLEKEIISDSIEVIKKLTEKDQEEEFKYSQSNAFNDADSTLKNLLATVPKLNCFILKHKGSKSRSGATNVMHAKLVLKNVDGTIGNIERRIFSFDSNCSEGLSDGGLFFLKKRFMQQQYLFTIDLFDVVGQEYIYLLRGFIPARILDF
jgi:hypothetical protein